MATGPEHYRDAERLLAKVTTDDGLIITNVSDIASYLDAAQVHATLAQAAASALSGPGGMLVEDETAWRKVASAYRGDGSAVTR